MRLWSASSARHLTGQSATGASSLTASHGECDARVKPSTSMTMPSLNPPRCDSAHVAVALRLRNPLIGCPLACCVLRCLPRACAPSFLLLLPSPTGRWSRPRSWMRCWQPRAPASMQSWTSRCQTAYW
jgi:hypothetical protein